MILSIPLSEKIKSRWPEHMEGLVKIDRRNFKIAPNHRWWLESKIRFHSTEEQQRFLKSYNWEAAFLSIANLSAGLSEKNQDLRGRYCTIDNVGIRFYNITPQQSTLASLIF